MTSASLRSASRSVRPIHPIFTAYPTACFVGALLTDIAYVRTAHMQWANFSVWLLTFGLLTGGLAAVAGVVDRLRGWRMAGGGRGGLIHVAGNVLVMALSLLNAFVHSRDAYTSVAPTGLILSILVVLILAATGWFGQQSGLEGRP